jgi:F420-0:gamma-glutamyl ligase
LSALDHPMQRSDAVELLAVPGIPLVRRDDDLAAMIGEGVARGGIVPRGGDVFVLAQKILRRSSRRRRQSSSPARSRKIRASSN